MGRHGRGELTASGFHTSGVTLVHNTYTHSNNPHNLTRLDVDASCQRYALVLSQYEKARDLAFTLSIYATRPFTLRPAPPLPPAVAKLEGVWDSQSAGGRLGQRTFMHNVRGLWLSNQSVAPIPSHVKSHTHTTHTHPQPQFRLVLIRPSKLFIELLAPKNFFVSFSLLGGHRGGRRVDSILQGEVNGGALRNICVVGLPLKSIPRTPF